MSNRTLTVSPLRQIPSPFHPFLVTLPMTASAKGGRKASSLGLTSGIGRTTASPLPDVMLKKF